MYKVSVAVLVAFALAGCSSMPSSGPSTGDIVSARKSDTVPDGLDLIDVDGLVARIAESFAPVPLTGRFPDRRVTPTQTIGVGDTLGVTIFEASAGGLFSTSNGQIGGGTKNVALPDQEIGPNGTINVPYVGRFSVVGATTDKVEKIIVDRLRDKAIEPQAVVTLHAARSNLVSVNGEIGKPGRLPLSGRGDRMLDVLADAGGIKGDPNELFVRLTRKGTSGVVPLRTVIEDATQNVWIWPGDDIFVYRELQQFTVVGASGRSGNFPMTYGRTTLAEALGAADGLMDARAEPAGVFVYRDERASMVCAIKKEKPCASPEVSRPVIYRLNLREPEGYALAQRFPMRSKDLVYVANADTFEVARVLSLLSSVSSLSNNLSTSAYRIHNWR